MILLLLAGGPGQTITLSPVLHTRGFGTLTISVDAVIITLPSVIHGRAFGSMTIVASGAAPAVTQDKPIVVVEGEVRPGWGIGMFGD